MHLYDDPMQGITAGVVLVLICGGLLWSKGALIDLIRGHWFE
jgi:hypothetical protein